MGEDISGALNRWWEIDGYWMLPRLQTAPPTTVINYHIIPDSIILSYLLPPPIYHSLSPSPITHFLPSYHSLPHFLSRSLHHYLSPLSLTCNDFCNHATQGCCHHSYSFSMSSFKAASLTATAFTRCVDEPTCSNNIEWFRTEIKTSKLTRSNWRGDSQTLFRIVVLHCSYCPPYWEDKEVSARGCMS